MLPHSKFKGSFWNRLCVCKDSILGTEEPFVSKLGTVVHCCQPKCLVKKKCLLTFNVKVRVRSRIRLFLLCSLNC